MATNHYFQAGRNIDNRNEQRLIDRMVAEVIQIKGFDVYYIPRRTENFNRLFGEDASSYFDHFHTIEMYLENVEGWGGDEMLSKFGLEIRESATFTVSRSRWNECTREDQYGLTLPNRPAEGDLLYFPLTKSFFEIRRVEHANPFYQNSKLFVYKLNCELYQYSHEVFDTGDHEVDAINTRSTDELMNLVLDEYGYAILGEDGGYILKNDFVIDNIDPAADNDTIRGLAESIIDWSVNNPLGSIERKGDSRA